MTSCCPFDDERCWSVDHNRDARRAARIIQIVDAIDTLPKNPYNTFHLNECGPGSNDARNPYAQHAENAKLTAKPTMMQMIFSNTPRIESRDASSRTDPPHPRH